MAQHLPRSPGWFDQHWKPRLDMAAKVLRDFQDGWLVSGDDFPVDSAAAAILHIFAFDFHVIDFIGYRGITPSDLSRRTIDQWIDNIHTPVEECASLLPTCTETQREDVLQSLREIVTSANRSWRSNTASPTCEEVRECLDYLAYHRLVTINR